MLILTHLSYIDIDECASSQCHGDATCTNTAGSYTCSCNDGYFGDGFTSVASLLVLGGGGGARPPNVPTKIIYVLILRERAKRASASETYIFRTQNTSVYNVIYNQCGFL